MREYKISADLHGITELTMIIPVKTGMVDAVGSMTYATRLRLLLKVLGGLRKAAQDQYRFKPFSDSVESIQFIHSFRLNLLEDSRLLLAVAFDGPWEPYIRSIWRELGPLLDVIMCNCVDYPISVARPFADYDRWIRKYQVPANFFYIHSSATVSDVAYLRQAERVQRETHNPAQRDDELARLRVPDPKREAAKTATVHPEELVRQGLEALSAIFGLRQWYTQGADPGTPPWLGEEAILLRATRMILKELKDAGIAVVPQALRVLYQSQLNWFDQNPDAGMPSPVQAPATPPAPTSTDLANVQGGILEPYAGVQTGCVMLLQVTDPAQARAYLAELNVTSADPQLEGNLFTNLAITWQGLRTLGLNDDQLALFPEEFRVGMEPRARLLGDIYDNHPTEWHLPPRNVPQPAKGVKAVGEVALATVDVLIQLRSTELVDTEIAHQILTEPDHPLFAEVAIYAGLPANAGLRLLHVQPLVHRDPDLFDFPDNISQPTLEDDRGNRWSDQVAAGEILLGYPTNRDEHVPGPVAIDPLLRNGTFLVVRKIQQDASALEAFLDEQQSVLAAAKLTKDDLRAKMMGRTPGDKSQPLVAPLPAAGSNDFNFETDADGSRCPFHAHIRRANPREPGRRIPRIMRRGMSYGPLSNPVNASGEEQGLLFMAYNSSIANQFEVIQRWISGGNSSGGYSGQADPFLGVPQDGERRTFRCVINGNVMRFDIDTADGPRLFTRLRWGMYLFVPSIKAIKAGLYVPEKGSQESAALVDSVSKCEVDWNELQAHADRLFNIALRLTEGRVTALRAGHELVEYIQGVGNKDIERTLWKRVFEDLTYKHSGLTRAVWEHIRNSGGLLDTEFGLLVARHDLMLKVLRDDQVFSVQGSKPGTTDSYLTRMQHSIGEIYLGLDSNNPRYAKESAAANAILMNVSREDAFAAASTATGAVIAAVRNVATGHPAQLSLIGVVDQVLAQLCTLWFGIPDGTHILSGGQPAPLAGASLHCPYHYTAPSRYFFLPQPDGYTKMAGRDAGDRLTQATLTWVQLHRPNGPSNPGSLMPQLFNAISDDNQLARTIVGIMMGFLPTVLGNILGIFYYWIDTKLLWRIQAEYFDRKNQGGTAAQDFLTQALSDAMRVDPIPEMIWRVTLCAGEISGVHFKADKKVVLSITSAMQELQSKEPDNVYPVFGGNRKDIVNTPPVHSCPAFDMGMGVLMGLAAGVLDAGILRPTPSPLALELR